MMASFELGWPWLSQWWVNAGLMLFIALMMVSRVPTMSIKKVRIPPQQVLIVLVGAGVLVAFLTAYFWLTLASIGVIYVLLIPYVAIIAHRQRRREMLEIP